MWHTLIHPAVWPHIDMDWKIGAVPLLGELGPHITQYDPGRCLPPYQLGIFIHPAVWSDHNGVGSAKLGSCCAPLLRGGELGPYLTQCDLGRGPYLRTKCHLDPSNCLATTHQRYRHTYRTGQTGQTGQRTDSIGRTVLQTVAQKRDEETASQYSTLYLVRCHCYGCAYRLI